MKFTTLEILFLAKNPNGVIYRHSNKNKVFVAFTAEGKVYDYISSNLHQVAEKLKLITENHCYIYQLEAWKSQIIASQRIVNNIPDDSGFFISEPYPAEIIEQYRQNVILYQGKVNNAIVIE